MSLVFYYAPRSSAGPVHWTLEELGVPYDKVKIDLKAHMGGSKNAELMKVNPNGKVPVLVHDGIAIFESAAIQIHLGENFGVEKGLFPVQGPARGEAMKWIVWSNVSVGEAFSRYLHAVSEMIPVEERTAKAGEVAKKDLEGHLGVLDHALADRPFLLGDTLSIPDLHVSAWAHYLTMRGIDLAPYAKLAAWVKTCTSRPAYARVNSET